MALSAAATVANIKIRFDANIPQFAIFGKRVIYVFYSIYMYICVCTRERDCVCVWVRERERDLLF